MTRSLLLLLTALLGATHTFASEYHVNFLRCGPDLLQIGDSTGELLKFCGKADLIEHIQSPEGGIVMSNFYYLSGNSRHDTIVKVRQGRVVKIAQLR